MRFLKTSQSWVSGLILASCLAMAGCEVPSEEQALLQAMGSFNDQQAILLVREYQGGMLVEALERDTQKMLASGFLPLSSFAELMDEVRAPLRSEFSGSTLRVAQEGRAERSMGQVFGPAAADASEGVFKFEGMRWLTYKTGVIEHGLEGRVRFLLVGPDRRVVGRFEGLTTRQAVSHRVAVVRGEASGSYSLTGSLFGSIDASILLTIPSGAGAVEVGGMRQAFRFNPSKDLTSPDGKGQAKHEAKLLASGPDYVEVSDEFRGRIGIHRLELKNGDVASGFGQVRFDIAVAVTRSKALVVGMASMDAALRTEGGDHAEFHGSQPQLQTELDW